MGNSDLIEQDPVTFKKIQEDIALVEKLHEKSGDLINWYDGLLPEYERQIKTGKIWDKKVLALECLNEACGYVKEADLITRKLISFYRGVKQKVPPYLYEISDKINDNLNELHDKKETLIFCLECVSDGERKELREKSWILNSIKLTEFNGSPASLLVEVMSDVIQAKREGKLTKDLENKLIGYGKMINEINKKNTFNPFEFLNDIDSGKYD